MQVYPSEQTDSPGWHGDGGGGVVVPGGRFPDVKVHPGVKVTSSTAVSPKWPLPTTASIKI